jgi:transposase
MEESISSMSGTTIGLDLGDRRTQACVLGVSGEIKEEFQIPTTARGLERGLGKREPCRVVLEAGTHSPWISHWLKRRGFEGIVANPRMLPLITQSDEKDDRSDAEHLARLGRADPKLLRPIEPRAEAAQRDQSLLQVRNGLVQSRASLVTQARGLAKPLGMRLPSCTTEGFASRMRKEGLEEVFPGMRELVEVVDHLTRQIRGLDREIEEISETRYPETKLLRQTAGVGPVTALAYVLRIEDPSRFKRSRSVGAYLGMRPRRRQSGSSNPMLRITKAGDPYLRKLLVQSAHYILGPYGPDTDLRRFGERLIARGGRAAKKKATVAVARKLAVLLHRLWVTAEAYEPLRHAHRMNAAAE